MNFLKRNIYLRLGIASIVALVIFMVALVVTIRVYASYPITNTTSLSGYAWSDTIGWISMNCETGGNLGSDICSTSDYGVDVSPVTGELYGYAWSDTIGWISFNTADTLTCPLGSCQARITATGLDGFARALAGGTAESGGWDGYINLNGVIRTSNTALSGYAWGSDVIGWVDMSGVTLDLACANGALDFPACTQTPTVTLSATPTTISYNSSSTLSWTVSGGAASCTASGAWLGAKNIAGGTESTGNLSTTSVYTLQCANSGGTSTPVSRTVTVCDSGNPYWNGSACGPIVPVTIVDLDGQYTATGTIQISCINGTSYTVSRIGGAAVGWSTNPQTFPYTASSSVSVSANGEYEVQCFNGTTGGDIDRITYQNTIPPAIILFQVSPTTVPPDTKIVMNWSVKYPDSRCSLTARVICPNNACSPTQIDFQNSLNAILTGSSTDSNDRATSRPMLEAVTTVAPGQSASQLALGIKTVNVRFMTDFTYDCTRPTGGTQKTTKRVNVTNSQER